MKEHRFFELGHLGEAVEDTEGLIWKAALIQAGKSENGRLYSQAVLERAVPLFDRVSVFIDHPGRSEEKDRPERSIRDTAGWIQNPRWDSNVGKEGAIVGELHLLESSPISAQIREMYERGNPDLIQLSIFGQVRAVPVKEQAGSYWDVKEINKIRSVDLVTMAAAGGHIIDVMHSIREEDKMDLLKDLTLEEVLALRPDFKEKFQEQGGDALEAVQQAVAAAVTAVLGKVGAIEKLSEGAKKAVGLARLAMGREDMEAAMKELGKIAADDSVDEDLRKEVKGLIAKLGHSEAVAVPEDDKREQGNEERRNIEAVRDEVEKLKNALRLEDSARKAAIKVGEAKLPVLMKDKLISEFSGRLWTNDELDRAIGDAARIYEGILAEQPRAAIRVVRDSKDKIVDLVTATVLGKDFNGVSPLNSIHSAYCLYHGVDPYETGKSAIASQIVRESIGFDEVLTAREAITWTSVFGTAMNRVLAMDYQLPVFDEWEKIVSDTPPLQDMRAQRIARIGYFGLLPIVSSGAPYPYAASPGEEEAQYSPAKRGMLEEWTWEQALNDDIGALRKIPKRLALAAKVTLYQFVFDLIDGNPTLSYVPRTLFHADHANTGALSLSSDNLVTGKIAMRRQTALSATDLRLAIKPKYLIVPTTLEATALQLIHSKVEVITNENATVFNPHLDSLELIVVDHWVNQARWYLVADPGMMPTIEIGFLDGKKTPQLFTEAVNSGSAFSADKVMMKIRFVFGGAVVDHRSFYGGRPS